MTPEPKRYGDIAIEFDQSCDNLVSAATHMLAYGLGKLPIDQREFFLWQIENGKLRQTAAKFAAAAQRPKWKWPNPFEAGHGHA